MSNPKTILKADWVVPMAGPALHDGCVVVRDGRILAIGPSAQLTAQHPDAELIDRPGCTILPGLVNAHTHLELSEFRSGQPPATFVDWIARLVPRGQVTADDVRASVARSVPIGVAQCLRFGVTCVGDISRHCAVTRPLLTRGPLRVVSYGEIQAMAARRTLLEERLQIAADPTGVSDFLRVAVSPHAPYSIEPDGYRRCLEVAAANRLPLATHLAETPDESPFLARHQGPFRELWRLIGAWDDRVPTFEGGPIRFAKAIGLLDYPTLLAHVNYCDDAEMDLLSQSPASVVYCPRTHAYFNHPPHRWRQMLARGVNVAVGTDSCASSPDLNLLAELRVLRRLAPDAPAAELWAMATTRAARAVQMDLEVGSLEPGKRADLIVFNTAGDDPLAHILDDHDLLPGETWIDGHRRSP